MKTQYLLLLTPEQRHLSPFFSHLSYFMTQHMTFSDASLPDAPILEYYVHKNNRLVKIHLLYPPVRLFAILSISLDFNGRTFKTWYPYATTLPSRINVKLGHQKFWRCHENVLVNMILTIPNNLYVTFQLVSLYTIVDYLGYLFIYCIVKGSWLELQM